MNFHYGIQFLIFTLQESRKFKLSTADLHLYDSPHTLQDIRQNTVACCLKAGIVESDQKLISWTAASIASQRLGKQLLWMQRMLTKVIPVITWITEENLPFDKVSPTRYARNLFQGREHFRHRPIRDEKSDQMNQAGRPELRSQIRRT
jgi:hypothetical protein